MENLIYALIASFIVSLVSFSGIVIFAFNEKKINKYMILFVALAAGTLISTATVHLIPESFELFGAEEEAHEDHGHGHEHSLIGPGLFILLGVLLFFFIEKFIHWHHHHDIECEHHHLGKMSLIADGIHNFIDGILIAVAFITDVRLGILTTIAIAVHEIPQEIGDFAILLHSGFSKVKALIWNFISALFSVIGTIVSFVLFQEINEVLPFVIAIIAGAFIYIALADIIPEFKKAKFNQITISGFFLLGIFLIIGINLAITH